MTDPNPTATGESIVYRPHENCVEVLTFLGDPHPEDIRLACATDAPDAHIAVPSDAEPLWAKPGDTIVKVDGGEFFVLREGAVL